MTGSQATLMSLLRASVTGGEASVAADTDWAAVMKESLQQTVFLTALDAAAPLKEQIPPEVFAGWQKTGRAGLMSNARVNAAQQAMIALLPEGTPYVILKGEAAAAYYPRPELRGLGDVDFLIDPARGEALERLFREAGYTESHEAHARHRVFRKPGAHLEMHYEPAGIPEKAAGERVRAALAGVLERAVPAAGGMGPFSAPAPRDHALILLLHMQHHMLGEGLGLRHLCDWACFVQKTADEPFWGELTDTLSSIGLLTYAAVMTATCARYLGTPCPDWAAAPEDVCEAVMEDILAGGNFGRKDADRSRSGMMVSNHGKAGTRHGKWRTMAEVLNASIREDHPVVKKVPVLYPVFFVWRVLLYGWRVLTGKRPSLRKLAPEAEKRKAVYDQLHIFEVESGS